ncbi:kelch domain-containing protein 3-like [Galendromus occidentalis]|uniref:Kelch domain-containing protein 3-like n=1 Tax=Galendromus occidentalis TaxID=34638 RepID=A0AAJ7PB19_9ACAR|nr:kelch domain-containing protein 3-like [Galendromus occidentalis]
MMITMMVMIGEKQMKSIYVLKCIKEIILPERPTWTQHITGGPKRANHAAVYYKKKIFIFGGYRHILNNYRLRPMDVFVFNTETLRWTTNKVSQTYLPFELNDYRLNTYGHTAVRLKNKVYIYGGLSYYEAFTALYEYDLDENTFTPLGTEGAPESRPGWSRRHCPAVDGHTACVIDGSMYVLGGHDYNTNRASNTFWALDLAEKQWREIETQGGTTPRVDHHVAWALGSRMYVHGGRTRGHLDESDDGDEEFCPMMFYDVGTSSWHKVEERGDVPIGRSGHSGFVRGRKLYMFGGFNCRLKKHFADMYEFDPGRWSLPRSCSHVAKRMRS